MVEGGWISYYGREGGEDRVRRGEGRHGYGSQLTRFLHLYVRSVVKIEASLSYGEQADPRGKKKTLGTSRNRAERFNATFSKSADGSEGDALALLGANCVDGGGKGVVKDGLGEGSVEAECEGRGRGKCWDIASYGEKKWGQRRR